MVIKQSHDGHVVPYLEKLIETCIAVLQAVVTDQSVGIMFLR